jgi:hypothetical protein
LVPKFVLCGRVPRLKPAKWQQNLTFSANAQGKDGE